MDERLIRDFRSALRRYVFRRGKDMTSDEMSRRVRELNAMDLAIAEHEQRHTFAQNLNPGWLPCPNCGLVHHCEQSK